MKKYTYCLCRAAALLLALTALLSCMSMSASALSFVSLPGANITDTTQPLVGMRNTNVTDTASASSMMEKMEAGIYWFGCFRDIYQALNLQYDRVSSVLTLDPMNFQGNELWILRPISSNSVYFTLEPLSHRGYYIAGQSKGAQLRLSKTSSSNYAVQWAAIPDGDRCVLVNRQTGLAMETANGSSTTGNKILNCARSGNQANQSWSMIRVSESISAYYPGSKVTIANGTYAILSAGNTAKCINVQFASAAGNGSAKICLDTWNYERHETYVFTNRGNGRYTISPAHATNLCLNVWGADPNAGNQITLATYRANDECSLWEIYQQNGYYSFRNVKTGLWLNLWCNTHTDGQKIVGYYYDGTAAMKWKLQSVSSSSDSAAAQSGSKVTMSSVLYGISSNSSKLTCGFDGYVSLRQQYGYRHEGIDFQYKAGTRGREVHSLTDGVVTNVKEGSSSSLSTVAIYYAAQDKTVVYLHLDPTIAKGATVRRGTVIGREDSRGNGSIHTHVEVRNGYRTAAAVSKNKVLENSNPASFWNSLGYTVK